MPKVESGARAAPESGATVSRGSAIRSLLKPYRLRLATLSLTSLVGGAIEAVFLVLVTRTAFAITDGEDRFDVRGEELTIHVAVLVALGLLLLRFLAAVSSSALSARLVAQVKYDLRNQIGRAYLSSEWSMQQADRVGQLQSLLTYFVGSSAVVVGAVASITTAGFNLSAMIALAFIVDTVSAVLVVCAGGLLAATLWPVRAAVRRKSEEASTEALRYSSELSELSEIGMEIQVFNVRSAVEARLRELSDRQARIDRRIGFFTSLVPAIYAALAYTALLAAVALLARGDSESLETAGAVSLLMLRSLSYGQAIQGALTKVSSQAGFSEELSRRHLQYQANARIDHGVPVGRVGRLELEDVSFRYPDGQLVLDRVDLRLEPGETIGVVGPSGAGKSTLVELLLGLRNPTDGQILSDGRSIRLLDHEEWSRKVTLVPQRAHLIAGTIADNVAFFRTGITNDQIHDATKRAHLDGDIGRWAEGLQRQVGDGGSQLSIGQQQRLSIARALLEEPDVLILDEPTSALDARSELGIRDTLESLSGEMTIVIVAHRPATLEICDRVVEVSNGKIQAQAP